ncbi:MAG TPA: glycoside hydrolase family 95 protein [Chitinophaga sp.]|uniref:glycoside hydrolase family 95 protein n=1 Tax=Chitinophaga sp. TaxID=1869181 RepID=UPI002CD159DE|nr:glycoside hydrolase family 95 protein [Chitinophaga sp.]HVI43734.1 glycoside hydrolase family 95 protein [Chitinophaga sp.]
MKSGFQLICWLCLALFNAHAQQSLLWYTKAADKWNHALPIGNGRMGAMIFGKADNEVIQLNEESLWAGNQVNDNNPGAKARIMEIQQLIVNGDNKQATELSKKYLLGTPPELRSYQTLGNLLLFFDHAGTVEQYRRSLDLETGVVSVSYSVNGVRYTREAFASAPDNCIVVHISASKPGSLNFRLGLSRNRDATVTAASGSTLIMDGQIIDSVSAKAGKGGKDMKFNALVKVMADAGKTEAKGGEVVVTGASTATVIITAATDYNLQKLNFDRSINSKEICSSIISDAARYPYKELLRRHEEEYSKAFARVKLDLGGDNFSDIPTDQRMEKVRKGAIDNQLAALYFQFGRYLLMSSSRKPGVLPANLQGIWNNDYAAPWNADFHTNINLQMNYWPADVANLPETFMPFAHFVDQLRVPGRQTAREMYDAEGWTIHHCTDVFGRTGIHDGVEWGASPLAAAWLCMNLWEHFRFTSDTAYLRNLAYPVMKEAAEFVQSFLVKDKHGYLVTAPSTSPENSFILPGGERGQFTYAPTIDVELIMSLYHGCLEAGRILKDDPAFLKGLGMTLAQLPPISISKRTGGIQEWIEDYEEAEPGHRHISHLLGLYPGETIKPADTLLFEAAKKTLERRLANGGGHTGWSRAWIINFYARLLDGEKAWKNVQALLQKSTLDNLLDVHPPFQIDGNFGGTAGIAEMLLQSHNGYIELLPALPAAWSNGEVDGLVARGGFTVKMKWKEGKLIDASLLSEKGGARKVKYHNTLIDINAKAGQVYSLNKELLQ